MSSNNNNEISNTFQSEYVKMKRNSYKQFFKGLMIFFSVVPTVEIFRAFFRQNLAIVVSTLMIMSFGLVFTSFILRLQTRLEMSITVFLLMFYLLSMIMNYHGGTQHFDHANDSFYLAYTCAMLESAIVNRIPKFSYRTFFTVSAFLIRETIIPANDVTGIPMHFVCLLFGIFLDYDKEKKDQELFGSHFYSQEQLTKFKDLVVNDIPDSIVIVSKDLNQCFFSNNAFNILSQDRVIYNISACLGLFTVQEILTDTSISSERGLEAASPVHRQQTLLSFIRNSIKSQEEIKGPLQKKICHVSYMKQNEEGPQSLVDIGVMNSKKELSFEVKILSLVWDGKAAIGIIFHDTTQQSTILKLKIAANIQKDRVLATVSHELRTPLNSMLGMIQIMLESTKDIDMLHYLKICNNSGYLLLGLVNSILDMNLIRANKLKLQVEKIHLGDFLENIMRLFEFQCSQKSIFLKLRMAPNMPKTVTTDKNRLSQIFINLIGNALKFTEKGGITISVMKHQENQSYIEMSVEDTGLGIKEEDRGKLFKIFGKLEQGGTIVNSQGVGLGLTISNNLSKLLCDNKELEGIDVQSEFKKGSKFSFIIKSDLNSNDALHTSCNISVDLLDEGNISENRVSGYQYYPSSSVKKNLSLGLFSSRDIGRLHESSLASPKTSLLLPKPRSVPFNFGGPSVLIVDDNPLNLKVAEFFVKRQKLQTKTALYGHVAIDLVVNNDHHNTPIVLILMDLQMPVMDGYQTTKKLKELMEAKKIPSIPIVALTANDTEADREACLKVGMADHLGKPLKESELTRVLKKHN